VSPSRTSLRDSVTHWIAKGPASGSVHRAAAPWRRRSKQALRRLITCPGGAEDLHHRTRANTCSSPWQILAHLHGKYLLQRWMHTSLDAHNAPTRSNSLDAHNASTHSNSLDAHDASTHFNSLDAHDAPTHSNSLDAHNAPTHSNSLDAHDAPTHSNSLQTLTPTLDAHIARALQSCFI
jgi:hypothetical protein